MGYGAAARHEPIGRTAVLPVPMRVADVSLRPLEAYPEISVFRCSPLAADIQPSACKANFLSQKSMSCRGCPIGLMHAAMTERTAVHILNDQNAGLHERTAAKNSLPCIRCEKSAKTNSRLVGAMRIVSGGTICVSCYNRQREIERGGLNWKGGRCVKWAHLQQATITIEDGAGEWSTLDIGLRSGRGECERYVARIHPGCTLIEAFIGGESIPSGAVDPIPTDWHPASQRAPQAAAAARKPKALPVATEHDFEPDDDETPVAPIIAEPVDASNALDPESVEAHWNLTADGLPEFIEWLTDGWPVAPFARVTATAQPVEVAQPVTDDSEWTGVIVRDGRGVEYDIAKAAAQFEVAPEKIAAEFGIPSNADMVFAGKTLAEWSERTGEVVNVMAARMVETGTPFAPAPKAIRPPPSAPATVAPVEVAEPAAAPEPEPTPEPVVQPVKAAPAPTPKKITGKQLRKQQKREAREARTAAQNQTTPAAKPAPSIKHTCRAFVHVLMSRATVFDLPRP